MYSHLIEAIDTHIEALTAARTALTSISKHGDTIEAGPKTRKRRTISMAGRKRIAAAQRARWAALRK